MTRYIVLTDGYDFQYTVVHAPLRQHVRLDLSHQPTGEIVDYLGVEGRHIRYTLIFILLINRELICRESLGSSWN